MRITWNTELHLSHEVLIRNTTISRLFLCTMSVLPSMCNVPFNRTSRKNTQVHLSYLQTYILKNVQICWVLWCKLILKVAKLCNILCQNSVPLHFLTFPPMENYEAPLILAPILLVIQQNHTEHWLKTYSMEWILQQYATNFWVFAWELHRYLYVTCHSV